MAIIIWMYGPLLSFEGHAPLAEANKRFYLIVLIYLLWLLKFLILDMDSPTPLQYKDPFIRGKLQILQKRFRGAMQFLRKTTINRDKTLVSLNQLPWYLLIGPESAGKTSLLLNSNIPFILQRQFQGETKQPTAGEHCDWWVTRDVSIIDVPGKYLRPEPSQDAKATAKVYPILWKHFLKLVKKQRGDHALNGILIALPLPQILHHTESKSYQSILRDIFQGLRALQQIFTNPIPCQLVITKCDLLAGFSEFFAESPQDEINQAWGITLPAEPGQEKLQDIFSFRFNALIKRLNQQLIFRLHQERNPMLRPYIKDFPLQMEKIKELIYDFIKKATSTHLGISLQGIYLTSALQIRKDEDNTVIDENINTTQRSVQLFKPPYPESRGHFIKHFLSHGITYLQPNRPEKFLSSQSFKDYCLYGIAAAAVIGALYTFGKDFQHGIKRTYAIEQKLNAYNVSVKQFHDPDEHLINAIKLLDQLQLAAQEGHSAAPLKNVLTFYSSKSQQKARVIYYQALQSILLPEIKNYFQDFLKNPVNRNLDNVYAAFSAYLMLNDPTHFQGQFIANTLFDLAASKMSETNRSHLQDHLRLALQSAWTPMTLDAATIVQTRQFLISMPSLKLSYIILKNRADNNAASGLILWPETSTTFSSKQDSKAVPVMFTARAFPQIFTQEAADAAREALAGNWVLGNINNIIAPDTVNNLTTQLRAQYVSNYVDTWETLLANTALTDTTNLAQTDALISLLSSPHSPLLQLLQIVYTNTYFEPLLFASTKLRTLNNLVVKMHDTGNLLYEIFNGLDVLHQSLQPVLTAGNNQQAAFEIISRRVKNLGTPDAITQLHLLAAKSPEPIRSWLEKIANNAWRFLMQDASRFLDTSWKDQVIHPYQTEIANKYPFSQNATAEVDLKKFTRFFGNPGIIMSFYNAYLTNLVDTSKNEWRWKSIGDTRLPFSENALRQIQQALRINRSFFPNGDNKLFVQFALQPYEFDKDIKNVTVSMNDKQIIDDHKNIKNAHLLAWPSSDQLKLSSIQLTLNNDQKVSRSYTGEWGWFKLINHAFETTLTSKQLLVNFSPEKQPAKYVLFTNSQYNPFLMTDIKNFHLSSQLTDTNA
jgi:type VI secretion system protein ImpL